MRLGAFTVVDAYPDLPGGTTNRVLEVVRLAETAEQAGLSSLWVAEHHFNESGACPSPPVLLAACGMRTRSLRLGSLVSVLPFHRPVDIAEEYALLDRLIGGRLNFGVGSGYLASEFTGFGIDPLEKRARFDAALAAVLEGLAGGAVRVAGDAAPPVRLNVLPIQQPHPPLWVAVQRSEAIVQVARRGLSIALIPYATVEDVEALAGQIAEYRAALPAGTVGEVAVAVHLYCGEGLALAREAFHRYVQTRLQTGSTFLQRKTADHPEHASPEAIERHGLALFGSGEEVATGLERFARAGVDDLLGIFDFGGLPPEEVSRSVRAAGEAWRRRSSPAVGPRSPRRPNP